MARGYEAPSRGARLPARARRILVACLAFLAAIIVGGSLYGLVAVLDPILQALAAVTALPGLVMLWRSVSGGAWQRVVWGAFFLAVAALAWGIVAITIPAER